MLHYQVVRTSPGGATVSNKMNNTVQYGHVRHTLVLMYAKHHLLIFSSFLDIWENVEWPRFLDHPVCCIHVAVVVFILAVIICVKKLHSLYKLCKGDIVVGDIKLHRSPLRRLIPTSSLHCQ